MPIRSVRQPPQTRLASPPSAAHVPSTPQGMFRAFTHSGYTRLWGANCLLYTSRWMQMTLVAWLVLELTNSPWLVALVGFFGMVPTLALGLMGGVLADRANRQRLLLTTQSAGGAASLMLTLFLLTGVVQVWHAYLTVFITGACWALDFPSRRALIYDLLGSSGVTNAMALDSVGMNVSRMLGPAMGGVLITVVGVSGGYVLITGFYAVALLLLSSLHIPHISRLERRQQPVWRNLAEGFRYIRNHETVLATVWITVVLNFLLFPYTQMVPVIARDVLHVEPILMGVLQASEGLGALVGALLIASRVSIVYHGRYYLWGSILALIALCLFSMSRWYLLSLPILMLLGFGVAGFATMQATIVILVAPDEMRGRALGVVSLAIGAGPLGSLLMGAIASAIHPVFAIRVNALLGIIALAILMLWFPVITERTQTAHAAS